jgi:outer membrane murein-binding lipoprotein Lpp
MISYSTDFPIAHKTSIPDVLGLALKWVAGSPHTKIPSDQLRDIPVDSEIQIALGDESVIVGAAKMDGFEIGGLRYTRIENDDLEWVTSIVTTKSAQQHELSIQVSCEALHTATRLPSPKKPYFIQQALNKLGGGMDGSIPVADKPFVLDEDEPHVAAALISGTADNRLPIIYVSATSGGAHVVDPVRLAKWMSGLAHVVVEPSRAFSFSLQRLTKSRNAYGGTVGVYWPESEARKSYFLDAENDSPERIQIAIANDIRIALSHRRQRTSCSWLHLRECISKCRYEKLKTDGSTELNAFIEAFDSELKAKEQRMAEAENEIARLNAELRKQRSAQQSSAQGFLSPGAEQDLYEGEIRDFAIGTLQDSMRTTLENSRRRHVLEDLLAYNKPTGTREQLENEVKAIFRSYVSMDARTRSALAKLGFDVSEDGKHYKAVFQGDGRYTFAISKTSSDHRGGKNMASDINRKLF